ncbi:MAG: histidine ammonia-lyase [Weeksellaceae bacterium]|nr:histidine ammonia-lyase [Weeksellaceae bacterium]
MSSKFELGKDTLTVSICHAFLQNKVSVNISEEVEKRVKESARRVQEIVESDRTVYGVNTGFGPLCTVKISAEETSELQVNILKSHAVGVGDPIEADLVRLMMLTKLHALCMGYSGIRWETIQRIYAMLQEDILPWVPAQGSVGASGDLAPLAHLYLPLIGFGKVQYQDQEIEADKMLEDKNWKPLQLGAKEGLALINGTQFILAHAVLGLIRMQNCLEQADLNGAVMIDALSGSIRPFKKELHSIRPFPGTQYVANNLLKLLEGSEIPDSHAHCDRVQDPYSLRCMPQVHGASRHAVQHLLELTEIELNSVTDNPIILHDGESISGGNFHGQPLAMAIDYAALAMAELGNIADRRVYLSLEGEKVGLPKLLLEDTGINSGFMIWQYTTAALVSENKSMCFPVSADSVPTSMGQEDHVSMGSISGRKLLMVVKNLEKIQAIELITACQALEFLKPLKSSPYIERTRDLVREDVPFFEKDDYFAPYIEAVRAKVQNGVYVNALKD